ncbi:hypothetical protein [Aquirhabdus parva]|uniref:Uncharacterized protein n=1 Tax=Aquirhabdus parva TaxID=2283318 RepID=A0A345P9A2_9GAMM|nr:hypothetical protein [Aquirhabdus parva]AXI03861.1 hypothetical protein HYN46_14055 [Aquirhabdus parva]
MLEYPKALYQSPDDYRIVADKSAETKARKAGFKDFADLQPVEAMPHIDPTPFNSDLGSSS